MAAPSLPAEVEKLRRELIRDQAPSARARTEIFRPGRFVQRYGRPYSSRRLPISTLEEMRTDALLRFAQLISLVPIFTGKWKIACSNPRKAQFIDHALRQIIGRLMLQFFECVPAGQRVMMADGSLRAIEDVREGDFVLSSDGTSIVPDQVEAVWSTEEKQILRIKLSDGRVMRVSPDHKVYRWGDWMRAGDLVIGDAVTVPRRVPYLGVDDWDVEVQKDDAFLLALWLAEGNKGYNQGFSVCNVDPIVVERARAVAQRKGWDFHHDPKRGVMRMTGNAFYRRGPTPPNFLRAYGVADMKTTDIGIPDQIMSAPTAVVSEFIGTYIACDGTVKRSGTSGKSCQTIFFSASERMVRDMQALLVRLTVRATVSSEPRQHGHLDCWKATISSAEENQRLAEVVYAYGKDGKLKQFSAEAVASLTIMRDRMVPPDFAREIAPAARRTDGMQINERSWTDSRRAVVAAEAAQDDDLLAKLTSGLGWARVVEIAEDGCEPCFDLQTREHHSFFLESGLVHNSWNFGSQAIVKEFGLTVPDWQFLDKDVAGGPKMAPVWDGGPEVPALVWLPFVPLSPRAVAPVWTPGGAFNGIALAQNGVGYGLPMVPFAQDDLLDVLPELMASFSNPDDPQRKKIDVDHALWITNERDANWGSIWGRPRLAYAFKYWWSYEMTLGILNRSVERKGDPTIVVSYPQGKSMVDGVEVDNQTIAMQIGESARSGAVLSVPSEVWGEDMATANQAAKWRIDYLKADERFDELRAVLDYLDTMKIRSMMISELSAFEGSGGCLDGDTPILCPRDHGVYPDGVPLEDIEPGRLVWAFNQESMRFELWPVKGVWCTMDDADLYKLTLDDGQEIVGTPDHPFMSRDGVWRRMDELKPGDRLMPFYESGRAAGYSGYKLAEGDYEPMVLLDPDHGSFEIEYRVIGEHLGWTGHGKRINIHHDDGRHANTELDNLHCMTPKQHAEKHFRDPVHRQKHSDAVRAAMAALTPEKRAKFGKAHWDEARWKAFSERQAIVGLEAITKFRDSLTPDEYKKWCTSRAKARSESLKNPVPPPREKRACRRCRNDFQPRSSNSWYCQTCDETRNVRKSARVADYEPGATNHRVVSVERLDEIGMVWDLEIDGPPHVRNFVAGGVVVHNTSSRNVAAVTGERSYEAQIFSQVEWDEIINAYLIPQLANANFPELADVPARKVTQTFGEGESALAADLLRSIANGNPGDLPVDLPALLDRFQIDALTGGDLEKWAKRMATQAETATQPPPAPAQPGGNAGVTDSGFYYGAPEQIVLEDDALLASLPKSKHYSDSAVLAQTRLVRRLYKELLTAQYEDFAAHVAKADLSLAEDDQADSAAARIVATWRYTGALLAKTVKAVALALSKVLARAGALELSASRIKTDAWKPDDEDLQQWARENAGALVRDVDTTTRKQLSTFLAAELRAGRGADEISANLRKHFVEFPNWRADLIATTETARYYNAGTLFAAQAAGAKQVQALDNQGSGQSDPTCVARHGRVYDVSAAWQERDHPRGTLSWRIIPAEVQLSFTRRSREDMGDVAARIDQKERVVYLVEGMDPATEGRFLERAVDWLVRAA